jgi:hypothetical protein
MSGRLQQRKNNNKQRCSSSGRNHKYSLINHSSNAIAITKKSGGLALVQLFNTFSSQSRLLWINLYLKAAGEVTFLTLVFCWCLTYVYHPEVFKSNVLKDRLGYNNPCVGWDFAPASYLGLTGTVIIAYFIYQYVKFDIRMVYLRAKRNGGNTHHNYSFNNIENVSKFTILVDYYYAISITLFPLMFLIGPTDSNWLMHTLLFLNLIVAKYLTCLAAYLNARTKTSNNFYFIFVYGMVSIFIPIVSLYSFTTYTNENRKGYAPVVNPYFLGTLDALWFGCVFSISYFLPIDEPVLSYHSLDTEEEQENILGHSTEVQRLKIEIEMQAKKIDELERAANRNST